MDSIAADPTPQQIVNQDPGAELLHWSSEPVPFDSDDQWLYDPRSKRFDLSRGSERKLVIDADDGVRHHRGCIIDPDKTVLVVIDMQNFFIHPNCCDHPGGLAAVAPTLKVIERCRNDGSKSLGSIGELPSTTCASWRRLFSEDSTSPELRHMDMVGMLIWDLNFQGIKAVACGKGVGTRSCTSP